MQSHHVKWGAQFLNNMAIASTFMQRFFFA